MRRLTIEVPLSLYRAIIFPRDVIQFDADPVPRSEMGATDVSYYCYSTVLELDRLANLEVGKVAHCMAQPRESWILV